MVKILNRYQCPKSCDVDCGRYDDDSVQSTIVPFDVEGELPFIGGNAFVRLHLCDVGIQIYDEFVDYVLFHMDSNGQDESDFLKDVKETRKEYEEMKAIGDTMIIYIDSDLLTGMNLLHDIKN